MFSYVRSPHYIVSSCLSKSVTIRLVNEEVKQELLDLRMLSDCKISVFNGVTCLPMDLEELVWNLHFFSVVLNYHMCNV